MKKFKILIIEDSVTFNNMLKRSLKNIASEIIQAFSFMQAEEYLENDEFDLILMDENMPIMNGIEATKKIRELEKETNKHIPIIAVTANALTGDKERFLEAGFDDYIPKPVDIKLLKEVMGKFL